MTAPVIEFEERRRREGGSGGDRYDRLRAVDWWDQNRVRQARVLVAGAGALGNEVIKQFALMGVGHLTIIDFDTVEVHNLTRSVLFRPEDRGAPKAQRAERWVRQLNPDVEVRAIAGDVAWDLGLADLRSYDVVLGCLDSREARLGLNRLCWKAGVPWVDGALGTASGQVRIFVPPTSACYECGLSDADYRELKLRYSCQLLAREAAAAGAVPTTAISASIIGAMQVHEALKLLLGQPVKAGFEIEYDGRHHLYRLIRLHRRSDCFSHDPIPWAEVVQLDDACADSLTGRQLLNRVQTDLGPGGYVELDREVVVELACPRGHGIDRRARPHHLTGPEQTACPRCGDERIAVLIHRLDRGSWLDLPLAELGIPKGHVLVGRSAGRRLYYALSTDVRTNS